MRGKEIEILLVEDNPGDVRLTEEALREGKVKNRLHVARDGVEAIEFLRRQGKFAHAAPGSRAASTSSTSSIVTGSAAAARTAPAWGSRS